MTTLRGQTLVFTGKVLVDGEWTYQDQCADMASARGALETKTDFSRRVTLVVFGDLASQSVTDPDRHYSKKLVGAARERGRGHHTCVVDAAGFSDLVVGWPAKCRDLKPQLPSGNIAVVPQAGDGVLGGPLVPGWARERTSDAAADLSHLDLGAAANTETVAQLIAHLEQQGIEVRSHGRGGPRFVAGWIRGGVAHIAEIENLVTGSEEQQICLGLGQLLDHVHQLESQSTYGVLRPVLVLEKEPRHGRWESLVQSRDVLLTWAPGFPGC